MTALCTQEILDDLVRTLEDGGGLADVEALLVSCPEDPRLHFLRGSVLAGERRYEDGVAAMQRAVSLDPGYGVARFQLGFLQFTSGDAAAAAETWSPFSDTDDDQPWRLFSAGLMDLTTDDIPSATEKLSRGMALNQSNPALNANMAMLIAALSGETATAPELTSETDLLLRQLGLGVKH